MLTQVSRLRRIFLAHHCKFTKTSIVPFAVLKFSKAFPIMLPGLGLEVFLACIGVEDVVSKSPLIIGPPSFVTLTGTLPTKAS
jgi:hypothetical protein